MRKILSVVLAVVMLASLATLIPVSAATEVPELVITEIVVDTTARAGASNGDNYEFIEVYNPSNKPISLYDYVITLNSSLTVGTAPDDASFTDFTPILSPEMSKAAGNPLGTIATSKQTQVNKNDTNTTKTALTNENSVLCYYPVNPDIAVLEPGEVAVIWLYTFDSYGTNYVSNNTYNDATDFCTLNEFKNYWGITDTLVVAIDANGSNSTGSPANRTQAQVTNRVKSDNTLANVNPGSTLEINYKGANNAANDYMTTLFPSSDGRFNGANSGSRYYGIGRAEDFKAPDARTTLTHKDLVSYVYVNYDATEASKNLNYAVHGAAGSYPDIAYNFTYTTKASEYDIGKVAGKVEFGDWSSVQYATPGKLLDAQVADFITLGSEVATKYVYESSIVKVDKEYVIYEQNFDTIADGTVTVNTYSPDSKLGWMIPKYNFSSNKAMPTLKIVASSTGSGKALLVTRGSTDTMIQFGSNINLTGDNGEVLARADYIIEYDIKHINSSDSASMGSDRYVGVIYNYNGACSYDVFILRVQGIGANQRRNVSYLNYDIKGTYLGAQNDDTDPAAPSIISKLTNGRITAAATSTDSDAKRLANLPDSVHVEIYVSQTYGPSVYVGLNGTPVDPDSGKIPMYCVSTTDPNKLYMWGASREMGDSLNFGLFVSNNTLAEIDNIKITAVPNMDELKVNFGMKYAPNQQPATGDATIYVVVAMAVAFVSLAVLVVAKRRQNAQ